MEKDQEIDEVFERKLLNLKPGERLVYHKGVLAIDAETNRALQRIRYTAMARRSRVSLIQQKTNETRQGFTVYLYIAEGRA